MASKELEDLPTGYSNLGCDAKAENTADKKLEDLPTSYSNLGYDYAKVRPSAPKTYEELLYAPLGPSPPSYSAAPSSGPLFSTPPSLVFEQIYDACRSYVKSHCCYGTRFLNQMKLTEIDNRVVYHYTLESFGEKRESGDHTVPYEGGPVDGPENGPPPDPWSIPIAPEHMFKNSYGWKKIPHTERVTTCDRCDGDGQVQCSSCSGWGTVTCSSCNGSGRSDDSSCFSCSGSGSVTCSWCSGSGKQTCGQCDGYGKVKICRKLNVTWKNHLTDYISEEAGHLPKEKIREATGTSLLFKEDAELEPIVNGPESINTNSMTLLSIHQSAFPNELIIRQRHKLKAIPSTRVKYQWKEEEGDFYVYDTDLKVYFEDYPQPYCCCTCC